MNAPEAESGKLIVATETALAMATGLGCGARLEHIHCAAEHVLGHEVWTHEFAMVEVWERMSTLVREALPEWAETFAAVGATRGKHGENGAAVAAAIERHGATVELPRGSDERTKHPLQTMEEVAPGKPVIVIDGSGR